jgi:general secretion pathway protein D
MLKIAFSILVLVCLTPAHATNVTIKTMTREGKPTYFLYVGAFPHENNALQLKLKLSSTISQPVLIENPANQNKYYVKIGPIDDYQVAVDLQEKLTPPDQSISQNQIKTIQANTKLPVDMPQLADLTENNTKKLWNLRNADIRAVIGEVSRVTNKNFIIDPRVQGKISIISSTPMSEKELYQVFLSMLQVSGYAAIPSGNIIKVVPSIDAKTLSSDLLSRLRNPPYGDDMMVEVIPVHYVPAEQLVPVLRPLMPQWSNVSAYTPSNMLILSGRASNIKQLARIIKQVDSSSASDIDMIHLKYALAMDVVNTLKDIVKAHPGTNSHNPPMLAADDRSNALLLSGSKTDRIRLRLLIAQLDRQSQYGNDSNTQVVYLNYLRAEDLVPILAGIAQANFSGNVGTTIGTITRPELDSTNPAANLANGPSSNSNSLLGNNTHPTMPYAAANTNGVNSQNEGTSKPTVQIIAEPNTNSIIINAPASLIRILKSVIRQLDIRPAQLLIEALVAEINEADICNLGIEWGSTQRFGDSKGFRPGFAIINRRTSIDDFQAQIYALAKLRKANILSTPSVVVLDNRQAKILIGKQVSVASTTYPNNASGTAPASPYVTYDRVNVALHLYVRPQITRGKGIQLQIDQGNDTINPASAENSPNPTFDISSIVTSVHIESGDIVVLGGLTQNSLANDNNKVPILGDIPGVGRLFQNNVNTSGKRVLMVFIRPIILRNENEALQVTGSKYHDIRQSELDWFRQDPYNKANKKMILPSLSKAKTFVGPRSNLRPIKRSGGITK